jgi:putative phosphoesterase
MDFIGLISDTHNLVRPEALDALDGAERIIHAGDVCEPHVLEQLREIAPVHVVRGNNDHGPAARKWPHTEWVELAPWNLVVVHDLSELDLDPATAGAQFVIYGHSHQPTVETRAGVVYINPGSAGPRRFRLPVSVARIDTGSGHPEILHLL